MYEDQIFSSALALASDGTGCCVVQMKTFSCELSPLPNTPPIPFRFHKHHVEPEKFEHFSLAWFGWMIAENSVLHCRASAGTSVWVGNSPEKDNYLPPGSLGGHISKRSLV
ncbi:gamma-glutamylcyclotransferase [Platysternon megacephalum]|uniref:Gamma-glutamylcyclotransferase n=1 Tax=Platysternon megacephalum TaxID=55544 RepID=A0A4D9END1_9SAUR|nr:gamma-glutamylcyclotransferase [Platysternon megacephalum]